MADKRRFAFALFVSAAFFGFGVFSPLAGEETTNTWFGIQGSLSGDTYLVGQRYGEGIPGSQDDVGSVHVFVREDANSWPETITLESLLDPGSLVPGAQFGGGAVLIDGDTAVVGAYRNTVGDQAQAGNTFVFTRSGSTWSPQTVLEMPGGALANHLFGASGDIDGDRLLLSAPGADGAYVFTRSGPDWDGGLELTGGEIENPLGLAIDGNLAAVGNFGSNPHVDLWRYNETSELWDFDSTIANPGAGDNLLGTAIDISDNTMVVSARQETVGESTAAGTVYVFNYDDVAENWSLQQTIENPTPATNDEFGYDVAINGDRLVVGAPRDDDDSGETDAGAAYVYVRSDSTWTLDETYMAETPEAGKWFGEIVDLSEDVLLAGGPGRGTDSGDVFWFDLSGTPIDPTPGDANFDGTVNELDAAILAANWMSGPSATWSDGDFNEDGVVNDVDATIMAANWMTTTAASVPEPSVFALLLSMFAVGLLRRRAV
ncbi:MAG: dockerin type I domain-containing protein [Planctomycetota bacterium]|nr:dockerin type I domain-containing protein [Planctomycetota bacterium]